MTATTFTAELRAGTNDAAELNVETPHGTLRFSVGLSDRDGAAVVYLDLDARADAPDNAPLPEPTPGVLRVNVNEGPVFNYADALNWYGEEQGYDAPEAAF